MHISLLREVCNVLKFNLGFTLPDLLKSIPVHLDPGSHLIVRMHSAKVTFLLWSVAFLHILCLWDIQLTFDWQGFSETYH